MAKGLLKEGLDVKVCIPVFSDEEDDVYSYDGIDVITYRGISYNDRLTLAGIKPNKSLKNFEAVLEREKPDVVHFNQLTNSNGISIAHIESAKRFGAKIVYTNHLTDFICQRDDLMYMGNTACDGIILQKRCTECLLQKAGYNTYTVNAMLALDNVATAIVGKTNYKLQLQPFVFPGFHMRWHLQKIKAVITTADAFVSITDWMQTLIKNNNLLKKNCVTIKTGIDLNTNTPAPVSVDEYNGTRPLKILYLGRVMPLKGTDVLINAVKDIEQSLVELHIYGPRPGGADTAFYDECTAAARGNNNIFFHEAAVNKEVVNLMRLHDVVCLPSKAEMAPLVIQEAMAAGVPVTGTDIPAIREWITDGKNGYLFPVGNAVALREKIMALVLQPSLLKDFKAQLPSPGSYSEMVQQYISLYNSIVNATRQN